MNPTKALQGMLKGTTGDLSRVLESIHAYLEKIDENTQITNSKLEDIKELLKK